MSIAKSRSPATDSTIIKPGGAGTAPQMPALRLDAARAGRAPLPRQPASVEANRLDRSRFSGAGQPPLIAAALPLLNLAGRLRALDGHPDLEALHTNVIGAVKLFEQKALNAGIPPDRVRAAHYALCATVDDVVLNADWGSYSLWARQSMVTTFHNDVTGGERFFDLLAYSHKDPGTNRDVLLLMYHCLSLGFEGRMRVHPQGHLELGRIREGLYRTLRGDLERELSPQWRGVDLRHRPLSTPLVLWTAVSLGLLALLTVYFALSSALDRRSDATLSALLQAPPSGLPTILRVQQAGKPAPATRPAPSSNGADLKLAMANEIRDGLASIEATDGGSRIRLRNEGLFDVGRADVKPRFAELIDRIGRVLRSSAAEIVVDGHTDTTPIHTSKYPSNYYLSVARAEAVAKLLAANVDPAKIRSEGRGAAEPIADNSTAQGREQNRRTDILVLDRQGS